MYSFFFFFVSWLYIVVLLKYIYLAMDYSRSFSKHGFYNSTDPLICHSCFGCNYLPQDILRVKVGGPQVSSNMEDPENPENVMIFPARNLHFRRAFPS